MTENPAEATSAEGELERIEQIATAQGLTRRHFVGGLGTVAAGGILAACSSDGSSDASGTDGGSTDSDTDTDPDASASTGDDDLDGALQASDLPEINWDIATSWPAALEILFGTATFFTDQVRAMTGGRFNITAAPAGDLVPALEIIQSVQSGAVVGGHSASIFYRGLGEFVSFGGTIPFGLTARQQAAWMYNAGGLDTMQALYRERFGAIQFPCGNTGVQMGGWYNREINSVADLGGLRMRIPGLGGTVMERLGVTPQGIPGGEIFTALETGAIDAAEFSNPHDDLIQEFNRVAEFYYYPGWWEPGTTVELVFSAAEFDGLPEEYQAVISAAAVAANQHMIAMHDTLNPPALQQILDTGGVQVLPFPEEVVDAARTETDALLEEFAAADSDFASVLADWSAFRSQISQWHGLAEFEMIQALARQA